LENRGANIRIKGTNSFGSKFIRRNPITLS